jgi:hypothetical protein
MSSNVSSTHPDYRDNLSKWQLVDNVIKSNVKQYLRNVGKSEKDPEKQVDRQKEYEQGAILDNFTQKTLTGLTGSAFLKPPSIDLQANLEYLLDNVDGVGTTLAQQAKEAVDQDLRKGRFGLLVDMPQTNGETTLASMENGSTVPRISAYYAEKIINWSYVSIGSSKKLNLVVLLEEVDKSNDIFLHETELQYRVLALDENGYYYQQLYDAKGNKGEQIYPRQNGRLVDHIPFYFIGVSDNTATPDASPLYPIAEVNVGHYRNSADTEENSFVCSQAMLILALGDNMHPEQWEKSNPDGVRVGSRRGLNVGSGGSAQFIQAAESDKAQKLMEMKKQQAVELGAQIIQPGVQVTAETARIQQSVNHSVLSSIASNVTAAYRDALAECAAFLGSNYDSDFSLNQDFHMVVLTAQDRAQWVAEIQQGISPRTLYYKKLREAGLYPDDWTDEQIAEELETQGLL